MLFLKSYLYCNIPNTAIYQQLDTDDGRWKDAQGTIWYDAADGVWEMPTIHIFPQYDTHSYIIPLLVTHSY